MIEGMTKASERFSAFMSLADFWEKRRQARQKFELAFSLALWATMAGSIKAFDKRPDPTLLGVTLIILFLLYYFFWIRPIWWRTERDARLSFYYQELATNEINPSDAPLPSEPPYPSQNIFACLKDWGSRVEVFITLLFCIAIFLLLGQESGGSGTVIRL